jgi:peptidoglycan/LPS O-acetylase OafA/YrhL
VALSVLETPLQAVSPKLAGYFVPNFLPFFLLGVSAWQLLFERDRKAGTIVGIAGALLYAAQLPWYTARLTFPYLHPIAEAALTAAIAIMLLTIRLPAPGWLAPLSAIGRWSYALYLLHQHIGVSIIRIATRAGAPDLVAVALAAGFVIGLSWLVHIWVELPGQAAIMKRYRALAAARPAT